MQSYTLVMQIHEKEKNIMLKRNIQIMQQKSGRRKLYK